MEKRQRGRWGLAVTSLALALALGLAATTAYLETTRRAELNALRQALTVLEHRYLLLNNATSSVLAQLLVIQKRQEEDKSSNYYDDEEDYYDEDSYDYHDDDEERNRSRRAVSGDRFSMVISEEPKRQNSLRSLNADAVVVIDPSARGTEEFKSHPGTYVKHHTSSPYDRLPWKSSRDHHSYTTPSYQEQVFEEEIRGKPQADCSGVAAQFGADTTRYRHSSHPHYDGNHRMYHPDGVLRDWSPGASTPELQSHFTMNRGELIVLTPGLYYIYAQVFYADYHDTSGFKVYINGSPALQCTTTAVTPSKHMKRNSCYTGGLANLYPGDKLFIKEMEGHRYTVFEPSKSFFGLFMVSKHC